MTSNKTLIIYVLIALNIITIATVIYLINKTPTHHANTQTVDTKDKSGETPYHKNEVKNTILKNTAELKACYEVFTKSNPAKKEGTLKIDWVIEDDGKPVRVETISNELENNEIENCVKKAIQTWNFPPTSTGRSVYVAHKFYFGEPKKQQPPQMINTK